MTTETTELPLWRVYTRGGRVLAEVRGSSYDAARAAAMKLPAVAAYNRSAGIYFHQITPVCPVCDQVHAEVPETDRCPDHGHAFVYDGSEEWQDHDGCPVDGCRQGRWTG